MKIISKKLLSLCVVVAVANFSQSSFAKGPKGQKEVKNSSSSTDGSTEMSCECDGKLTTLTLKYLGDSPSYLAVIQQNGEQIYEDLSLLPNEVFAITGTDQRGKKVSNTTLGPKISLFLNDGQEQEIHTSCSVEINGGDIIGDFLVITGTSRNNGLICDAIVDPCNPKLENCSPG